MKADILQMLSDRPDGITWPELSAKLNYPVGSSSTFRWVRELEQVQELAKTLIRLARA